MQDPEVIRHPGVYDRRPASTFWWFYQSVPADLAHRFPKSWADRCSLKTRDLREANARAKLKAADWERTFAAMRLEERATPADRITPDMAAVLAQRVAVQVLRGDDSLRANPAAAQALLVLMAHVQHGASNLTIGKPPPLQLSGAFVTEPDPWEGLPDELRDGLAALNSGMEQLAAHALAGQRVAAIEKQAHAEARALGFTFTRSTPGALEAVRACLRTYREAWASVRARDAGHVVDTPQPPEGPEKATEPVRAGNSTARRIGDALVAWEGLGVRKPKTLSVFRRHVAQFLAMAGDPLLSAIGKPEASRFTADLQRWAVEKGKTKETADNLLASIKAPGCFCCT